MPEHTSADGADHIQPCARCKTSNALLTVRSEHLCKACFLKYVGGKVSKRLETNRVRGGFHEAEKTLLLPVSFDVASICLLHTLDQQVQRRLENGSHIGYTLHILCVDESCIRYDSSVEELLPLLKTRFSRHLCSVTSLADISRYGIDLNFLSSKQDGATTGTESSKEPVLDLETLLSNLPSATSRADVLEIMRRRLTVAFAKQNGCNSIVYSDSSTKLAERTLSETAKGRGGALPWLTADNVSTDGIPCSYPLRDLFQKELFLYAETTVPSLMPLIIPAESKKGVVSLKDMTIDGLMGQYFQSLEENFPSIVANVVRTSSKLAPRLYLGIERTCDLCKSPIGQQIDPSPGNPLGMGEEQSQLKLCTGCFRTLQRP